MRSTLFVVCAVVLLSMGMRSNAELVNNDFLLAIGDFEKSTYVRWFSVYNKSGYDFSAGSIYTDPYTSGALHSGYRLPAADYAVADGWIINSGANVDPTANVVCRVASDVRMGLGNYQFIGVKGAYSGSAEVYLEHHVSVDNTKSYTLHTGDTVTFKIDRIMMADYSNLPPNVSVSFFMRMGTLAPAKQLTASGTAFSDQISAVIPTGVADISLQMYVITSGNLGTLQPGIFVGGAHLYVKRAGSADYEKWEIPAPRQRGIKTQNVFFHSGWTDIYAAARDYDVITTHEEEYCNIGVLRRINPQIKVYLYQSGSACLDKRDSAGHDALFNESPLTYSEVLAGHPDWLYTNQNGPIADPMYPGRYPLKIANTDYQGTASDRLAAKAAKLQVDGLWIDDTVALAVNSSGINRAPWEVQQFAHAVYPKLKAAGLRIIHNACAVTINGQPTDAGNNGAIYFNPFWVPNVDYPAASGYSANAANNIADTLFQEWAFFMPMSVTQNTFDKTYWYRCLQDMDILNQWNTSTDNTGVPRLGSTEKREMHMWVLGRDFPNDPAYGRDGWINFGLCSYLLGQNDWTYFGARVEISLPGANPVPYPDIDYSITKRLGTPDGTHQPYSGDIYCRYRRYKATTDGGLGGVVVVNGNTDASRAYTLDFDATDESGNPVPSGTTITLKPHTGRIFLRSVTNINISLSVPKDSVAPGQTVSIAVNYVNNSDNDAKNVVIKAKVPDEMTYVVGSAETAGGFFDPTSNSVSWVEPFVPAGGSGTKTFSAKIK